MIPFALTPDRAFAYDIDDLLSCSPRALLLANPQNPSGVLCPREALTRVVEEANRQHVYVLLDEAFIDYCPEASLAGVIDQFPNLIIFRSVTKFFGMAGVRVAYGLANRELASRTRSGLAPWLITTLASLAARVAVEDEAYCRRTISLNTARRRQLQTGLETLGIHVYPSAANFLLLRLPRSVDCQQTWEDLICVRHVVLRNCRNYEGLADGHLRTAILAEAENRRLLEALAEVLGKNNPTIQKEDLAAT